MINYEEFKNQLSLEKEEVDLKKKLHSVQKDLENKKNTCDHLELVLGYHMDEKYNCCLICGAKNIMPTEYSVDASKYLPDYDIVSDEEFADKFNIIQTMTYGVLRNHNEKDIEDGVLATELNNIITSSLKEDPAKQLIRKK